MRFESLRKYAGLVLGLVFFATSLSADSDDFGFKPMRRKLRYVEEFYGLFAQNHLASTDSTEQNIWFLQVALNSPFVHPIQALCVIRTEDEHTQYKRLLRSRIAFLVAQGYLQLGYRYDKEDIYWFNLEFADELSKGFKIAEHYYREAIVYWNEAKRVASEIQRYRRTIRLSGGIIDAIQDEARKIHEGDINYQKIIDFRLRDLEKKQHKLESMLKKAP
ncbi:MAG TPA: hypothetical protein PLD82_00380 [Spirochaetota bacterium]|nr:hypothetical protein [Spirochaetota bacterium]HPH01703.1 hypothetical protein [Spirochaetota bacterium]